MKLRNDGGPLGVTFNGMDYHFGAGEEREVDEQMALALQYRCAHLGLHIVEPGDEPVAAPEIMPIPEVAEEIPAEPAPETPKGRKK